MLVLEFVLWKGLCSAAAAVADHAESDAEG